MAARRTKIERDGKAFEVISTFFDPEFGGGDDMVQDLADKCGYPKATVALFLERVSAAMAYHSRGILGPEHEKLIASLDPTLLDFTERLGHLLDRKLPELVALLERRHREAQAKGNKEMADFFREAWMTIMGVNWRSPIHSGPAITPPKEWEEVDSE